MSRLIGLLFAALLVPCAWAGPVNWPVPPCGPADVATASPAPMTSDSASLKELPFVTGLVPATAGLVIGLNPDNTPLIRCVYLNEASVGLEGAAIVAVAGMRFATPRVPNTVVSGGRYLVRVGTLFGISWIRKPPRQTLLPRCGPETGDDIPSGAGAPKPVHRVPPVYPEEAETEAIEGSVDIVLDVFSSGAVSPACIAGASPAGWFEAAAVEAVSQWLFDPPTGLGPRQYRVTIKFRMEN